MTSSPSRRRARRNSAWAAPLALASGAPGLHAQGIARMAGAAPAEAVAPNVRPTLAVRRLPWAVVGDGVRADGGWVGAAEAANRAARAPRDNARPPVRPGARDTYDATHLHVALIAWDDPGALRAALTDRDQLWSDDYIGF